MNDKFVFRSLILSIVAIIAIVTLVVTVFICDYKEKRDFREYVFKTVAEVAKIEDPCKQLLLIQNLGKGDK